MKVFLSPQSFESVSDSTKHRLVNLYMEANPEGSDYPFSLLGTPGLTTWVDLGTGVALQGVKEMGDDLYAVSNNTVYKIDSSAVVTNIGTMSGSVDRVDMTENGTQVTIITVDGLGFVATSSSVAQITDGDFPSVSSATTLDGYTIVSKTDSNEFFISTLDDTTVWDALDFGVAEEKPDDLVAVEAFNGALWLLCKESYEVYYNTGSVNFPFEQIPGAVETTVGLASRDSVVQEDKSLFLLGNDGVVYRTVGYGLKRISTHGIETQIENFTKGNAIGVLYEYNGHKFYNLTFPSDSRTLTYDIATGAWADRTSIQNNKPKRWRANNHETFAGLNLVGDYFNGKIYKIDGSVYTEDGTYIERILQGAPQWSEDKRMTWHEVVLDMDSGTGLITGQGNEPQMMMTYTDDKGKTWSNENWRSFGKIGEFFKRLVWRRLGMSRRRSYKFRTTEPVEVNILGAYGIVSEGSL